MIQQTSSTQGRSQESRQGFPGSSYLNSDQMCEYIEDNPKSAVLIGLGLGFGAGLVLASFLSGSTDYFSRDDSFAERIGNKVADSLGDMIPSSWKNRLRS